MSPQTAVGAESSGGFDFAGMVENPDNRIMQAELQPGDVIYLPAEWWHRIQLKSDSIGRDENASTRPTFSSTPACDWPN
jgi:hypothetical protein